MKVVINARHSGFSLSDEALRRLKELAIQEEDKCLLKLFNFNRYSYEIEQSIPRNHPLLVRVVEELGEKANGYLANLRIVNIPDGTEFVIEEEDGFEWVAEEHRKWYPEEENPF